MVLLLHGELGEQVLNSLEGQKPALMQKIANEAKQSQTQQDGDKQSVGFAGNPNMTSTSFGTSKANVDGKDQAENMLVAKTMMQLKDDIFSLPSLRALLGGSDELIAQLKMPNPKKRLKAIVEIKKQIQRKTATVDQNQAREMLEPLQLLVRELLKDDNNEVYIESLNLLKFIVGILAP